MTIDLPRADTLVLWGPYPVLQQWRDSLAVMRPGAQYTRAYKRKQWDGLDKPGRFRKIDGAWSLTLGRGWLARVLASFPDAEIRYGYDAVPLMLCLDLPEDLDRDYQRRTLELIQERRWGRVALATNAGKGAVIALAALNAYPRRVTVLCNEVAVFGALQGELARWAPREAVGYVEAGRTEPPAERVVLAMVQTLHNRLYDSVKEEGKKKPTYVPAVGPWAEWAEEQYVVLADEADLATGDVYTRVLQALPNTEYRAGFSGSFPEPSGPADVEPLHADRALEDILGPVLIRVKNATLVERGISARPLVELVPYHHAIGTPPGKVCADCDAQFGYREDICPHCGEVLRKATGPERRAWTYRRAVVVNEERHAVIRSLLDVDEPNTVLVEQLEHGRALEEFIPGARFLQGSDSRDEREEVMAAFRRGDFQTLIATRILDRGTNLLGHATGIILASAAGSARQVLQRVGRGLRRGGGKEFVYLRDILDRGSKYLDGASAKRVRVYRDEGFEMEIRDV